MSIVKKFFLFEKHVCPWWLAYSWDNRLRRIIHHPDKILKPYLKNSNRAADIGCGMGYFTTAMVEYVGQSGKVYAVDVQQKMLDILKRRSQNLSRRLSIETILTDGQNFDINESLDFILMFWMLHEVENKESFLAKWYALLNLGGKYLLVEPKIHTTQKAFDEEVKICLQVGFKEILQPKVWGSRAILFKK